MQYPCRVYLKVPNPYEHTAVVCHNRLVDVEGNGPLVYCDEDVVRLAPIGQYIHFEPVMVEVVADEVSEVATEGEAPQEAGEESLDLSSGVNPQDMTLAQLRKYILTNFQDQKSETLKPLKKDDLLWLIQELQTPKTTEAEKE